MVTKVQKKEVTCKKQVTSFFIEYLSFISYDVMLNNSGAKPKTYATLP